MEIKEFIRDGFKYEIVTVDGNVVKITTFALDENNESVERMYSAEYVYNDMNQMIKCSDTNGVIIHREYDKFGRVEWSRNQYTGEAKHYIYNGNTDEVIKMELLSRERLLVCESITIGSNIRRIMIETDDDNFFNELKDTIKMNPGKNFDI